MKKWKQLLSFVNNKIVEDGNLVRAELKLCGGKIFTIKL